jgi:hypothetical protein
VRLAWISTDRFEPSKRGSEIASARVIRRTGILLGALLLTLAGAAVGPPAAGAAASFVDPFDGFDSSRWVRGDHSLGRSALRPANVGVADGNLDIVLPAGTLEGGEIRSSGLLGPGKYRAVIRVPDAPSSITGFFLYQPPDAASEIDVEVFNDTRGKVLFSTWSGGDPANPVPANTVELDLGFDPTAAFHEYGFDFDASRITFLVDGVARQTWDTGIPSAQMSLYVNAWFPRWLAGQAPTSDRHVLVDSISYTAPAPPDPNPGGGGGGGDGGGSGGGGTVGSGGPGSPTPTAPPLDRAAPTIVSLTLTNTVFRVGPEPTAISARTNAGTRFRFRVSEPGRARIRIERVLPGRRLGTRCRPPSAALRRRPRCTRYALKGTLLRRLLSAGAQSVAFSGRIGTGPLSPGRYRATITTTDAAGNVSRPRRVLFTIVAR